MSAPTTPLNVSVISVNNTTVDIHWTDSNNGLAAHYIQRSTDAVTWIPQLFTAKGATGCRVTGLTPDTLYYFRFESFTGDFGTFEDDANFSLIINDTPTTFSGGISTNQGLVGFFSDDAGYFLQASAGSVTGVLYDAALQFSNVPFSGFTFGTDIGPVPGIVASIDGDSTEESGFNEFLGVIPLNPMTIRSSVAFNRVRSTIMGKDVVTGYTLKDGIAPSISRNTKISGYSNTGLPSLTTNDVNMGTDSSASGYDVRYAGQVDTGHKRLV